MDKSTLLAYKDVFNFWIDGGSVLCRYKDKQHHKEAGWMELNEDTNFFSANCFYIENDAYVEWRKARTENKTIEFKDEEMGYPTFTTVLPTHEFTRIYEGRTYRMSPDEPTLVTDVWVQTINGLDQITNVDGDNIELFFNQFSTVDQVTLWEPKVGELCIFWDERLNKDDIFLIGYFASIEGTQYKMQQGSRWKNVAPPEFIQTLKGED